MDDDAIEIVKVTATAASTSSRVVTVQAAGVGAEGDDDGAQGFDDVEVAQPCGLMARPSLTRTTEGVCVRRGDELVALVLIDKGAPAQDVEAGETRLYGVNGSTNSTAVIRIRANGDIDVTAKSARSINLSVSGGGSVVLAGGSLEVARRTDPVTAAAGLLTTLGQIVTLLNTAGPVVGAPGTVTPFTGPTVGTITSGATNVKA